jgi:hypothetical protein
MRNILIGRIDHLNFKDGETVCSTRTIRATHSTIIKLYIYIYIRTALIYARPLIPNPEIGLELDQVHVFLDS